MVTVAFCEYCSAGLLLKHLLSSCGVHCVSHLHVVLKINQEWVRTLVIYGASSKKSK